MAPKPKAPVSTVNIPTALMHALEERDLRMRESAIRKGRVLGDGSRSLVRQAVNRAFRALSRGRDGAAEAWLKRSRAARKRGVDTANRTTLALDVRSKIELERVCLELKKRDLVRDPKRGGKLVLWQALDFSLTHFAEDGVVADAPPPLDVDAPAGASASPSPAATN